MEHIYFKKPRANDMANTTTTTTTEYDNYKQQQ